MPGANRAYGTTRVVTRLGPWRECSDKDGASFFYHVVTQERKWDFAVWNEEDVIPWIEESVSEIGYPLVLQFKRKGQPGVVEVHVYVAIYLCV